MSDQIESYFEANVLSREAILKTLNSYEQWWTSNYLMYHDSYQSYCNEDKTMIKRKADLLVLLDTEPSSLCRVHYLCPITYRGHCTNWRLSSGNDGQHRPIQTWLFGYVHDIDSYTDGKNIDHQTRSGPKGTHFQPSAQMAKRLGLVRTQLHQHQETDNSKPISLLDD